MSDLRKSEHMRLVPKPLATIIPCPYEQREDASRSIAQKLDVIAAELVGLTMACDEVTAAHAAIELRAIIERVRGVRRMFEVPDVW